MVDTFIKTTVIKDDYTGLKRIDILHDDSSIETRYAYHETSNVTLGDGNDVGDSAFNGRWKPVFMAVIIVILYLIWLI